VILNNNTYAVFRQICPNGTHITIEYRVILVPMGRLTMKW